MRCKIGLFEIFVRIADGRVAVAPPLPAGGDGDVFLLNRIARLARL
jgi:hypothetical protein